MDEKYGKGNWPKTEQQNREYSQLKKYGDRSRYWEKQEEQIMENIYFLRHVYKFIDDYGFEQYEDYVLGFYSSEAKALDAVERYFVLPGFNQYPKKCFIIEKWKMDNDMTWKGKQLYKSVI